MKLADLGAKLKKAATTAKPVVSTTGANTRKFPMAPGGKKSLRNPYLKGT